MYKMLWNIPLIHTLSLIWRDFKNKILVTIPLMHPRVNTKFHEHTHTHTQIPVQTLKTFKIEIIFPKTHKNINKSLYPTTKFHQNIPHSQQQEKHKQR